MKLGSWIVAAAMAVAGVMTAVPAAAQFAKPGDAVKYRKAVMTVMGAHAGRIGAVVKGEAPYSPAVASDAKVIETLSHLSFSAFGPGTDVGETRALPEVWSERAKFDKAAEEMQKAVAELAKVAASGDEGALKGAFGAAGKACKNCHDDFRER